MVARGRLRRHDRGAKAKKRDRKHDRTRTELKSHPCRVSQLGLFKQAELDGATLARSADDEQETLASLERHPLEDNYP